MGMIRKTLSIGTLGLVSFRGKSERLERAETNLGLVVRARDLEHAGRVEAEARAAAAQLQLKLAKREVAAARKQSSRLRKRGKRSRPLAGMGDAMASAVKSAEPAISSGVEAARVLTHDLAAGSQRVRRKTQRGGRRAKLGARPALRSGAESAQQRAHDVAVAGKKLGRKGRKSMKRARATATEQAKHIVESGQAVVSDALDR